MCACVTVSVCLCVCVSQSEKQQVNVYVFDLTCMCVTLLSTTVILSMYICMFLCKLMTVVSNVLMCYSLILIRCYNILLM